MLAAPRQRLCVLRNQLCSGSDASNARGGNYIQLGSMVMKVNEPRHPEKVPRGYVERLRLYGSPTPHEDDARPQQEHLQTIRFIMQKLKMRQDIFLLGVPGALRRHIALAVCELLQLECEYVQLSADTTESSIKQRREIRSGTSSFVDGASVLAAIHGRVLILDGMEKAERNVLPVLNNLLENREMQLDDGRMLVSPERYQQLLDDGEYSQSEMDAQGLVPVHPDFRILALGLPVPPHPGHTLDPPLRSRFQAKVVAPVLNLDSTLTEPFPENPAGITSTLHSDDAKVLVQLIRAINSMSRNRIRRPPPKQHKASIEPPASSRARKQAEKVERDAVAMDDFVTDEVALPQVPHDQIPVALRFLWSLPSQWSQHQRVFSALQVCYPYFRLSLLGKFDETVHKVVLEIASSLGVETASDVIPTAVPLGAAAFSNETPLLPSQRPAFSTLLQLMQLPASAQNMQPCDVCIVGGTGTGKSFLVHEMARQLAARQATAHDGFAWATLEAIRTHVVVPLYRDLTAESLLQQRATRPNGDTYWKHSALLMAVLSGSVVILDGVDRLAAGTLECLHRLLTDRELDLPDGTRMLPEWKCRQIAEEKGFSTFDRREVLNQLGLHAVHPGFRVIALASMGASDGSRWFSEELSSMFCFVVLDDLSSDDLRVLLENQTFVGSKEQEVDGDSAVVIREALLNCVVALRGDGDSDGELATCPQLSSRQVLRIYTRVMDSVVVHPSQRMRCLADQLLETLMVKFMPHMNASAVVEVIEKSGISCKHAPSGVVSDVRHGYLDADGPQRVDFDGVSLVSDLRIARLWRDNLDSESRLLVPEIQFFENARQLSHLRDVARDLERKEHVLLVGNQGVGKNKIADYLLQLLRAPREYIQLHRDTTVDQLTVVPQVVDGHLEFLDSPLVRAAVRGRVAVIDEADKASTHVTIILKSLAEDRQLVLPDGRRLVPEDMVTGGSSHAHLIPIHRDFRMIILANRPGYPFLGNNFYGTAGDVFATHIIDNPDADSELELLTNFGPRIPRQILCKLVDAFAEIRALVDDGTLSYP